MKTRYKTVEGGKDLREEGARVEVQGRAGAGRGRREEWERRFISGLLYT